MITIKLSGTRKKFIIVARPGILKNSFKFLYWIFISSDKW